MLQTEAARPTRRVQPASLSGDPIVVLFTRNHVPV